MNRLSARRRRTSSSPEAFPRLRLTALGVALVLLAAAPGRAEVTHCLPEDPVWTWVHPQPHGQTLVQVSWVPERSEFVAMGDAVMTTTDGATWSFLHGFAPHTIRDSVWNGTSAVAVGTDPTGFYGVVFVSSDFTTWTEVNPPISPAWEGVPGLYGVAWDGLNFVAVGLFGAIYTSPDGTTWTLRDAETTNDLLGVTWTGTQFVVAGERSTLLGSADGTTWAEAAFEDENPPSVTLRDVFWNGSESVAMAFGSQGAFRKSGALEWETIPSGGWGPSLSYFSLVDGEFYAMDHSGTSTTVHHSTDGSSWSSFSVPGRVEAIAGNGAIQVAVGFPGQGASNESGSWQSTVTPLDDVEFRGAVHGEDGYVAVGGTPAGVIFRSPDGETWTPATVPGTPGFFTGVATDGASYVAVGDSNTLVYSSDGLAWQDATVTPSPPPNSLGLRDVTWGPSGFVAVGDSSVDGGVVLHSSDGVSWQAVSSETAAFLGLVQFTGERYVAISDVDPWEGTVVTSTDGVFWQVEPQPVPDLSSTTALTAIVGRPDLTLLMGSAHKTWTSSDGGRTWQARDPGGSFTSLGFEEAIPIEGEILAAVRGGVETSTDGLAWTRDESLTSRANTTLVAGPDAFGDDQLLVLGRWGIMQSTPLTRDCAPLPDPHIFTDDFESGDACAWSSGGGGCP